MHFFISVKLIETLELISTRKSSLLSLILPDGKTVRCEELCEDCPIRMYEHGFLVHLYKFELTNFGVILGIDRLAKHQAQIDRPRRKITLRGPNREKVVYKGKGPRVGVKLISVMKARKFLSRRCEGFLCNIVKIEGTESFLEDIPIVREFPYVFSKEILGMPTLREVEFFTDLTPALKHLTV